MMAVRAFSKIPAGVYVYGRYEALRALAILASMLAAISSWAQFGGMLVPPLPKPASEEEKAVKLKVENLPLGQALQMLSQMTGYLFVCDSQLKEKTVSLDAEDKPIDLLLRLARSAGGYPYPAIVFCAEDEKPKKEVKFDLPDKKVTATLTDMDSSVVVQMVAAAAGVKMAATEKVLKKTPKISVNMDGVPVAEAIQSLAKALGAKAVKGAMIVRVDYNALFEQFMNLPPAEQEKIVLAATRRMQQMNIPPEEIDRAMTRGLERLWREPPERRQQIIARVAERINRFASVISRFSPEAREEIRRAWQPVLQRGIGKFMGLPAEQKAELAPIVEAIGRLAGNQ